MFQHVSRKIKIKWSIISYLARLPRVLFSKMRQNFKPSHGKRLYGTVRSENVIETRFWSGAGSF